MCHATYRFYICFPFEGVLEAGVLEMAPCPFEQGSLGVCVVDGIYSGLSAERSRLCCLVVMGCE